MITFEDIADCLVASVPSFDSPIGMREIEVHRVLAGVGLARERDFDPNGRESNAPLYPMLAKVAKAQRSRGDGYWHRSSELGELSPAAGDRVFLARRHDTCTEAVGTRTRRRKYVSATSTASA